ncbi:imidazole glycerol phosphate synthase subunit HisH [Candidatus Sulfidibacterium hydrothermale]|uniref:imidazole glycerol phosphate synthase subunit HisH n=1 Tax=Candidatus Sulfidibacterium hydrothermale TaxID=2875962 RepID=UPI001F0B1A1B|nr:imidazole glycerol phosphate synthase subunit HisH [Candidatus Sulfidibacterium hydrothermale]UBM61942.1 imidazole glycerol phosphate synthase subunit HisH [Candidatus Sulfidibacterium hydrothermale]
MKIAIIDYGAGNVRSVQFALERLGVSGKLTAEAEEIIRADKVIFPGVGEASSAMDALRRYGLDQVIPKLTQPVLGICLGLQLLCEWSEEGNTDCLGVFPAKVRSFPDNLKVPQVGWNTLSALRSSLFQGVREASYAYFVHSYYVPVNSFTIAQSEYGIPFSAAMAKDNFYACQFHPEKSSTTGEQILKNFLKQ